ncbi:hypothetical protein E1B28_012186 [Marasmius oreades]|uniref:Uncharacterized protein n=1 Tax=Marasmius oreades TaxID=181124 RepID=A0A9P7RR08_9AGAR|nr:uncharacterized protein E1B28_012186 [Marasmius oreades]KAG7088164.1 hypothetical protein E1B28_012186 [Marasmius oreades]
MTSAGPLTPSGSSSSATVEEVRPQAGPLPLKRGEIGYREDLHEEGTAQETSNSPEQVLPERHPADRENTSHSDTPTPSSTTPPPTSPSPAPSSTDNAINKPLKRSRKICYGGITLSTLMAFLIQLLMVFGTITGWVVTVLLMNKKTKAVKEGNAAGTIPSSVFVHVVFTIAILGQLLFLERRLYRLRAERYAHLHPGEIIPSSIRYGNHSDPVVAFSPWNRPPLPTYAATLAQSGVGTGDAEDHIIAQPPPPAYGNTRGSTLLLSGFLRNSLRAQRPVSSDSTATTPERPVSYRSMDSEWEVVQDARRAQQLERTLATLERNR